MKGVMCANGAPHSKFLPREEAKSTKITLEVLLSIMVIDEYEGRKVENFDVPGEYLQIDIPKNNSMLLLLEGKFVDIMCDINPEYKQHVKNKEGRNAFYICIIRSIY